MSVTPWSWTNSNSSVIHDAEVEQYHQNPNRYKYTDYILDLNENPTWPTIKFHASSSQVMESYTALTEKLNTAYFNQRVWNDMVDKIVELQIEWYIPESKRLNYEGDINANPREVQNIKSPYISSAIPGWTLAVEADRTIRSIQHYNYGKSLRANKFNLCVNAIKVLPIDWIWAWDRDRVTIKQGTLAKSEYILQLFDAINYWCAQSPTALSEMVFEIIHSSVNLSTMAHNKLIISPIATKIIALVMCNINLISRILVSGNFQIEQFVTCIFEIHTSKNIEVQALLNFPKIYKNTILSSSVEYFDNFKFDVIELANSVVVRTDIIPTSEEFLLSHELLALINNEFHNKIAIEPTQCEINSFELMLAPDIYNYIIYVNQEIMLNFPEIAFASVAREDITTSILNELSLPDIQIQEILSNSMPQALDFSIPLSYNISVDVIPSEYFDVTFANSAWSRIVAVCDYGIADILFNVGDTRDLGTGYYLTILGFNHDVTDDGITKTAMSIQISNEYGHVYLPDVSTYRVPNDSLFDTNSYIKPCVETFFNDTSKIPLEISQSAKTIIKDTDCGTFNKKTFDVTIAPISPWEMYSTPDITKYASTVRKDGNQYEYYVNNSPITQSSPVFFRSIGRRRNTNYHTGLNSTGVHGYLGTQNRACSAPLVFCL